MLNFWKNKQLYDGAIPDKNLLYYLSSEYSNDDPFQQELNFLKAVQVGHRLTSRGYNLIQPVVSAHPANRITGTTIDYEGFKTVAQKLIDKCDGIIVLKSEWVKISKGVAEECSYAEKAKDRKLILCYNYEEDEFYEVLNAMRRGN